VSDVGDGLAFAAGTAVALSTSWLLVSRIERLAARLHATEALLGLVAALAADTPEVTASISALSGHRQAVSAGVVIGSNVFNLATLLGLSAVVAGRIGLHRRVVLLNGAIGTWVAAVSLLVVVGAFPPAAGLALVLAAVGPYALIAALPARRRRGIPVGGRGRAWIEAAVAEEEGELRTAIEPPPGRLADGLVAAGALVAVVSASVVMERAAAALGRAHDVPDLVVGAVVLAAVTSLPNAVAAVYLANRGRGAAMVSTAFNSNAINVAVGLLLPASIAGLGSPSRPETVMTAWYVAMTVLVATAAYRRAGLDRRQGSVVLGVYAAFVVVLVLAG